MAEHSAEQLRQDVAKLSVLHNHLLDVNSRLQDRDLEQVLRLLFRAGQRWLKRSERMEVVLRENVQRAERLARRMQIERAAEAKNEASLRKQIERTSENKDDAYLRGIQERGRES